MDAIDVKTALRNILQILQTDPVKYRNFGIYWWFIKTLLKREYTKANLSLLGDYMDNSDAAKLPGGMDLQATLKAAFVEYQLNASFNMGSNRVQDANGSVYIIFDQDAGF